MTHDSEIMRLAQLSVDAGIKDGRAADGCQFRFVEAEKSDEIDRGGSVDFAIMIAAWCAAQLGARAVPPLKWFRPADVGEKTVFGSDTWDGDGLMMGDSGVVWLREDMPAGALIEVVAHEMCHAVKHRNHRAVSIECEVEAIKFARSVADIFGAVEKWAELFVVGDYKSLPSRAQPTSLAITSDDPAVYKATGSYYFPRWKWFFYFCDLPPLRQPAPMTSDVKRTPAGDVAASRRITASFEAKLDRLLGPIETPVMRRISREYS